MPPGFATDPAIARRALAAVALVLTACATLVAASAHSELGLLWVGAAFLLVAALWSGASLMIELRRWNRAVLEFSERLEAGDLTSRIDVQRNPLHAPLAERLNACARSLARAFVAVSRSAHESCRASPTRQPPTRPAATRAYALSAM